MAKIPEIIKDTVIIPEKNKKVSYVIPTYNMVSTIEKTIQSCIQQEYPYKEIIIVDDGSTDNTKNFITKYIKRNWKENIKYIYQENMGTAQALNRGIKESSGEYLSWISADDYYIDKKATAKRVLLLENNLYIDFVYSDFYDLLNEKRNYYTALNFNTKEEAYQYNKEICVINGSTLLMRRKVIYNIGLFNYCYRYRQDYDYWFRLLKYHKGIAINQPLIERTNDVNLMARELVDINGFDRKVFNLELEKIIAHSRFFDEARPTVCAMICMKNEDDLIEGCIDDLIQWTDKIVIFNDGSTDYSPYRIHKYPKVKEIYNSSYKGNIRTESEDRQKLLEMAQAQNTDWILFIDSITGDRCVPIKDKYGKIDIISIEDLFNKYLETKQCIEGKEFVYPLDLLVLSSKSPKKFKNYKELTNNAKEKLTTKEQKVIEQLSKGISIKTIAKSLNTNINSIYHILYTINKKIKSDSFYEIIGEWQPIKKIIRHYTDKQLFELYQKNGITKITEDHSLITIEKNEFKKINVDNLLKERRFVPNITNLKNKENTNNHIKLSNELFNIDYNDKYIFKFKQKEYRSRNHKYYKRKIATKCFIDFLEKQNLDFFLDILGAYISEGSCSDRDFSIANKDYEWLKKLLKELKILCKNIPLKIVCDKNIYYLRSSAKILRDIFGQLGGIGSHNKKIPSFVFNLEEKYQKILFDSMIKGDGSLSRNKYPTYTTVSLRLCSGICFLLLQWNKTYNLSYRKSNKSYQININLTNEIHKKYKVKSFKIKKTFDYVYDIEVENNHIFTDACGMLLLHNTDEVFEHSMKWSIIDLMNNQNAQLYSFLELNFWRGYTHYRTDELWLKGWFKRLFRNQPGLKIYSQNEHCGGVPYNIQTEPIKVENVRVKHYGFTSWQRNVDRYTRRMERDPYDQKTGRGGAPTYDRMLDENGLELQEYEGDTIRRFIE